MYFCDLLLFRLSWRTVEWANPLKTEHGGCCWDWASPVCLLRAASVVELVMMWSWACPALISRASSPGCVVLTMLVSVPQMPRYTGLCTALQALQGGPICLLSSEFAVTSVIWKQTRWIHVCVFYHVLLSGRCVSVIYLVCLLRICWALWLPSVLAWGTWKNIWPFHGNPFRSLGLKRWLGILCSESMSMPA